MISYPELGMHGRLGNHLFQIAATIGAALDYEETWAFPHWTHEKDFPISGCFQSRIPRGTEYRERRFAYDLIPNRPELRLYGYFQSEKYFGRHKEVIRSLLTPPGIPERSEYAGVSSLQVRRGDYLNYPERHPVLPIDYFHRAMEYLRGRGIKKFLVFSDDLDWCRSNFTQSDVEVIPPMMPMDQFKLTLACEHHIMANSTFSWWTAWLDPNPGKIVIAPKAWFGPEFATFDTSDLYAKGWVIM